MSLRASPMLPSKRTLEPRLHLALLAAAQDPAGWLGVFETDVWTTELLGFAKIAGCDVETQAPEVVTTELQRVVHEYLIEATRRMGLKLEQVPLQTRLDGGWAP